MTESGRVLDRRGQVEIGPIAPGLDPRGRRFEQQHIAQLQLDEPALRFVVPESGGTLWSDVMCIPKGSPNAANAARWMDYVYDPVNAARIAAYVGYIPPVAGVQEVLAASDDEFERSLAENELMFPSEEIQARLQSWGGLAEDVEAAFDERFSSIIGA